MEILTLDCLEYIFKFLSPLDKIRAAKVNSLWKQIITERWYRGTLVIRNYNYFHHCNKSIDFEAVMELCAPRLDTLTFYIVIPEDSKTFFITLDNYKYSLLSTFSLVELIQLISKYCHNVKKLLFHLSGESCKCNFTSLLKSNTNIEFFSLVSGNDTSRLFDFDEVPTSVQNLKLEGQIMPSSALLIPMLVRMHQLKSLSLMYTGLIDDVLLETIITHRKNLQHLSLSGRDYEASQLQRSVFLKNISRMENLKYLYLDYLPMGDNEIIEIASKCTTLEHLHLGNVISNNSVDSLNVTCNGLSKALSFLINLNVLDIIDLLKVHKINIENEMLSLKRVSIIYNNHEFDVSSLSAMVEKMPVLSHLFVSLSYIPPYVISDLAKIVINRKQIFVLKVPSYKGQIIIHETTESTSLKQLPVFNFEARLRRFDLRNFIDFIDKTLLNYSVTFS